LTNEKKTAKLYGDGKENFLEEGGRKRGRNVRMPELPFQRRRYVFVRILYTGNIGNEQ